MKNSVKNCQCMMDQPEFCLYWTTDKPLCREFYFETSQERFLLRFLAQIKTTNITGAVINFPTSVQV